MIPQRQLPQATLCLILASSLVVLLLGIRLARQEHSVAVEQDQTPLSRFTAQFLREIESLDDLYASNLASIQQAIDPDSSALEIASICRDIVGIEQATLLVEDRPPKHLDVRDTDRSDPLPLPHRLGDGSFFDGVLIDDARLAGFTPKPDHYWIGDSGSEVLHYVGKAYYNAILVLRIHPPAVNASAEAWMTQWLATALEPIQASGLLLSLQGPTSKRLASSGVLPQSRSPDFLLPIPSRFGDWHLASWRETETVVRYHPPLLIGSAAVSVVLALAGLFGFVQQRRAVQVAEQRVSFVNRVSHELRTPMTNILLNTDLLSDSLQEEDSLAQQRIDLVRGEAHRLSRLIENVLTFSQREQRDAQATSSSQNLRTVPTELGSAIDGALSSFSLALSRKGVVPRLQLAERTVQVLADPDALRQIFSNLISNVEKYVGANGQFEISSRRSEEEGVLLITFSDNGPGISPKHEDRVFRPFARLDNSTTEGVSGTGLGLAIARDLAENMGGRLTLEKNPPSALTGAHFTLALPLHHPKIISMAS